MGWLLGYHEGPWHGLRGPAGCGLFHCFPARLDFSTASYQVPNDDITQREPTGSFKTMKEVITDEEATAERVRGNIDSGQGDMTARERAGIRQFSCREVSLALGTQFPLLQHGEKQCYYGDVKEMSDVKPSPAPVGAQSLPSSAHPQASLLLTQPPPPGLPSLGRKGTSGTSSSRRRGSHVMGDE